MKDTPNHHPLTFIFDSHEATASPLPSAIECDPTIFFPRSELIKQGFEHGFVHGGLPFKTVNVDGASPTVDVVKCQFHHFCDSCAKAIW